MRERISELLQHDNDELNAAAKEIALIPKDEVQMLIPVRIPNYTDFYSSEEHATNVGSMFRDPKNALLPNWKHIPVGYHGRASSIVVSGTNIHRPKGQIKPVDSDIPIFCPSQKMDFELEMAFITCKDTKLGSSISAKDVDDYIFGDLRSFKQQYAKLNAAQYDDLKKRIAPVCPPARSALASRRPGRHRPSRRARHRSDKRRRSNRMRTSRTQRRARCGRPTAPVVP